MAGRPPQPAPIRYWKMVDRQGPDECWPWLGAKSPSGYGNFRLDTQTVIGAHQFAWTEAGNVLDSTLTLDHTCHNRACQNPRHLRQVTFAENLANRRPRRKRTCDVYYVGGQ